MEKRFLFRGWFAALVGPDRLRLAPFFQELTMSEIIDPKNPIVANDHFSQVAGHLIVPFGTTANNLVAIAGARAPAILARAVGLDGEHNLPAEGDAFTINNGSAEDWERVRAWRMLPGGNGV
jgi:hypothetical protein